MRRGLVIFAAVCGLFLSASAAQADPYLFTLTGLHTATFVLDSSPTPDSTDNLHYFRMENVVGTYDSSPTIFPALDFYVGYFDGGYNQYVGAQLFTGTVEAPTFILGTYGLSDGWDGYPVDYTLTIAEAPPAAVPEPSTWAMMLVGFGVIGFAIRRNGRAYGCRAAP